VGESILQKVSCSWREMHASSADLTLTNLTLHYKFDSQKSNGGAGVAEVILCLA